MCLGESAGAKFELLCADFPNVTLLAKSASSGKIKVTFVHASVGNKSMG